MNKNKNPKPYIIGGHPVKNFLIDFTFIGLVVLWVVFLFTYC